jgi:hypothetical protein
MWHYAELRKVGVPVMQTLMARRRPRLQTQTRILKHLSLGRASGRRFLLCGFTALIL